MPRGERTSVEAVFPTVEYQPLSEQKPPDLYLCAIGCGYLGTYDVRFDFRNSWLRSCELCKLCYTLDGSF